MFISVSLAGRLSNLPSRHWGEGNLLDVSLKPRDDIATLIWEEHTPKA
jgi:hypothetical protein